MKTMIAIGLGALLLTTALAVVPTAAAECVDETEDTKFADAHAVVCTSGHCGVSVSGDLVRASVFCR